MPYRKEKVEGTPDLEEEKKNGQIMDSEFIPIDDLVYAPLHALAKSNHQLRSEVVEAIRGMGTSKHIGQEEVIHLNNINIAYDQIRPEGEEGYSVDNLQVQVPLLSIVPVTNLGGGKGGDRIFHGNQGGTQRKNGGHVDQCENLFPLPARQRFPAQGVLQT